jgi:hypothetical protein
MTKDPGMTRIAKGQQVIVTHLQGEEHGEIESINFKTGKVLVFFNYPDCPHFDSFNLSQVRPVGPILVK